MAELAGQGIPLQIIVQHMRNLVSIFGGRSPSFAHVNAAAAVKDKSRKLARMIATLCQPAALEKVEQIYDTAAFVKYSIQSDELLAVLEACASGADLSLAGVVQALEPKANFHMKGSGNAYTGEFACFLFEIYAKDRQPITDWYHPLIKATLPPYYGIEDGIRQWFPTVPFRGQSDARLATLFVAVPLITAPRLGVISLDGRMLHVAFNVEDGANTALMIVARNGDSVLLRASKPVVDKSITIELEDGIDELNLWLVDSTSNILDYFSENRYACSRTSRVLHGAGLDSFREREILDRIQQGESDTLELKPFVRDSDPKAEELVETAVAFANAFGGTIYVGVNRHGEIDGIEKEVFRAYRNDIRKRGDTGGGVGDYYCQILRRFLAERGRPSLQADIELISLASRKVVRIQVKASTEKPVADARTGNMFIRRGASNGKLNAEEIRRIVSSGRLGIGVAGGGLLGGSELGT